MRPILFIGLGLVMGCAEVTPQQVSQPVASASLSQTDLCAEHGVLEAVCPKCNPSLAPVFQAKGDWCDEHGFPESFCPICAPEHGGRPVVDDVAVSDGAPPDGTIVRFKTKETARLTGLATEAAIEAPWAGGTTAVARIAWDATRVAAVSARTPGVVSRIEADVGVQVQVGDTLAVLRSAHVGGDRARLLAASRSLDVAQAKLDRRRDMQQAGVASVADVLDDERDLAHAQADLATVRAELGMLGTGRGDAFEVVAPMAGVVTVRRASVGQSVGADAPLFEVVDASVMWAELDVAEADLSSVATGQAVRIHLDALPDRVFEGTIAYLAPMLDPRTRTVHARVVLDNADGALRANLYGSAEIVTEAAKRVVTVPSSAVQNAGDVHLVFVRQAEDAYVARRVAVLARRGKEARIAGGVRAGDQVVTTGSFLLKTETLKDSIGAGCCDVE